MSDFVGGVASRRVAALRVVIVSYPLSLIIIGVVAPFVGADVTLAPLAWGIASGIAGGLAVWWFYLALAAGPMSIVSPVTAVLVAGVPVLVGLALGERPTALAYGGIALALIAVVMVSRESRGHAHAARTVSFTPTVAWLTVGSGIAFALAFVAIDRVGDESGLWPLVASRAAATAVVWGVAAASGQFILAGGQVLGLAAFISVLDVVSNVALLYAFNGGLLSLVSVIASLYPAATVLLAMVMLGERVGAVQKVGMALAFGAVGLIAVAG